MSSDSGAGPFGCVHGAEGRFGRLWCSPLWDAFGRGGSDGFVVGLGGKVLDGGMWVGDEKVGRVFIMRLGVVFVT